MKKIINLILLIMWLILIYVLSSFNSTSSANQSGIFVNIISNILNVDNIDLISFIVRKLAHTFEYFVLSILMINCIKDYKLSKTNIISILLCILYACLDEVHQLFISGRAGQVRDVLIDSLGVLLGFLIYKIFCKLNKKK